MSLALALAATFACGAAPRAAFGYDGLYLAWDDCRAGTGATDMSSLCSDVFLLKPLVCSVASPVALDSIIAAEVVVDVQSALDPLPPYWRFDAAGCDAGQLTASTDFSLATGCGDAWNGHGGAVLDYRPGEPRASSQGRIVMVAFVPSAQAATLAAGSQTNVAAAVFSFLRGSNCAGCSEPACLVLNSILLRRMPGAADVLVVNPGEGAANQVTWRGGAGVDCAAVPVRARTWGNIKALYR